MVLIYLFILKSPNLSVGAKPCGNLVGVPPAKASVCTKRRDSNPVIKQLTLLNIFKRPYLDHIRTFRQKRYSAYGKDISSNR
ncbi:putative transmembrane protein [Escherichia phage 107]|nr:hypothetical protein [Shigella phage ESh18]WEW53893.1 putative transmembrane protein [Escherichia phage 107]